MDVAELKLAIDAIDTFLWPDSDEKLRRKRERILRAATDLFVRFGYRKTSMDDVAKRAGVAKGTVYLYYRNKAELVYHAASLEERTYLERMMPLGEKSLTPRERLRSFITLSVRMTREMPLLSSLIQGDHEIELALQEVDKSVSVGANKMQIDYVVRLLKAASGGQVTAAELQTRGQVMIDMLFALTTSNTMNAQGIDWDDYVDTLADVIIDGAIGAAQSDAPQGSVKKRLRVPSKVRKSQVI